MKADIIFSFNDVSPQIAKALEEATEFWVMDINGYRTGINENGVIKPFKIKNVKI
jgi:hypothetical protein